MQQSAVLVVDDEPDMLSGLRRLLSLDHYHVETAGSIAEMMQGRDWSSFVAVLIDRKLPDGNAEDILAELKRLAPDAAVIIITGHSDLESTIASFRAGAADYLLKPVNPEVLRDRLRRINELRLAREALQQEHAKREQTERLLRESEERFRLFMDNSPAIAWMKDEQGCYVYLSRRYEQRFGVRLEDWLGKTDFDIWPREIAEGFRKNDLKVLAGGKAIEVVEEATNPDGTVSFWRSFKVPFQDAKGTRYVGGIGADITDRKRAEEALQEREERLRAVLNTAADAIITIDQRGVINGVNLATERMFGYSQDELLGQNVNILMPAPYKDEHDGYIARYLETGEARTIGIGREVVGHRKDGSTFPVGLEVSEVGLLGLFTGIIRDISTRKKLERDVLSIAEDEQRRIGQDLHDSVQQELAGLGMLAQTLFDNLAKEADELRKGSAAKRSELAKKIVDGIARTHQQVQTISRGLVPVQLDDDGFMNALRELASRTDGLKGVTCAFKCEQPVEVADSVTATHLYRIAQEAVTNALKHGRPEHILIALESENGYPILQIADDGAGFDSTRQYEGMGLKTMRYRASLVGANLTLSPVETGGMLVTCNVFGGVTYDD